MNAASDGTCLRVDLEGLAHNWHAVRSACPRAGVGAVLKHDAYGLGMALVAPRLWALGCRDFWVATVDEALALRQLLPARQGRILVLHGMGGRPARDFAAQAITPVLAGPHELPALAGHAARHGAPLPVALQLDTGLTRLGFGAHDMGFLRADSPLWADARADLWVSHLGRFHDPGLPECQRQRERFVQWTAQLPRAGRSMAASSGVWAGPDWHFEHVRAGSALFGTHDALALRPVASLHAPVLRVADVAAGTEVGYGGGYRTAQPSRIATVAIGYGDGLPAGLGNRGSLHLAGRPAPIVGGVAMGMVALDVSGYAPGEIQPGMWAEVYGACQPLPALAQAAGMAANALLALSARLARRRMEARLP